MGLSLTTGARACPAYGQTINRRETFPRNVSMSPVMEMRRWIETGQYPAGSHAWTLWYLCVTGRNAESRKPRFGELSDDSRMSMSLIKLRQTCRVDARVLSCRNDFDHKFATRIRDFGISCATQLCGKLPIRTCDLSSACFGCINIVVTMTITVATHNSCD